MNQLKPLGPQAMMQRMQEFRAQMGLDAAAEPTTPFQLPTQAAQPSPLAGAITKGGSFAPMNPFGAGVSVQSPLTPDQLRPLIERAANENSLDPALFDALVQTESAYNPLAKSPKNAIGLTQLMPDTARGLGVTDPYDPVQNLKGGAKYLSSMIQRFDGNIELALAAYNAGPGAVERAGGIPRNGETPAYVERIMDLYRARRR